MDRMAKEKVPGCAVSVYLHGKNIYSYAAGFADIESNTAMTGREMINIYSCSKIATVTAACQLLEKGLILLNDPLGCYIPEFSDMMIDTPDRGRVHAKNQITVGDLFGMTAGFDYKMNTPAFDNAYRITGGKMDTLTVIKCLAAQPLVFEPGSRWNYSLCHDVLAALVEVVSGKKFRDYVKENIFDPLDMRDSFYHRTPEIETRMASQYRYVEYGSKGFDAVEAQKSHSGGNGYMKKEDKSVGSFVQGPEYDSGGAGIVTTVPDYVKLIAALSCGGSLNGIRILSPNTVSLMTQDRLNDKNRDTFNWSVMKGYGYGLGVRTLVDRAAAGTLAPLCEFGWGGAAGSTAIADTQNELAVFYAHHMLNPQESWYQPRLRNVVYSCLES